MNARTRVLAQVSPGVDQEEMYAGEDGWVPVDWVWSCPRHTGLRTGECVHGIDGGGFLQSIGCQTVSFAPFETH